MATPTTKPIRITGVTSGITLATILANLTNVSIANAFRNIGSFFESIGIGARGFTGFVHVNGTQAVNAVTFSSFVDGDTVTVNGVVLTGKNSPTGASQFAIGATDTLTAAAFAARINNTDGNGAPAAKIWGVVTATSAAAVSTITANETGAIGNLYTLAISAHGSVTGATFASGADGTITKLAKGL